MTAPDDLKVGMYIVVTHDRIAESHADAPSMFGMCRGPVRYSGIPYKITAISLPFIAVVQDDDDDCGVEALDVRQLEVQKVTRQYYKAWAGDSEQHSESKGGIPYWSYGGKTACQRCGGPVVERLTAPGKGVWSKLCSSCVQNAQ